MQLSAETRAALDQFDWSAIEVPREVVEANPKVAEQLAAGKSTDLISYSVQIPGIPEPTEKEFAGQTFTACTKYCAYKSITDEKARRVDPFVLRGSEMYLIHAEALCNRAAPDLAGAVADIKALEARARGISASSVNLPYSDAASVNALIEKERILELCFEGHRLLDILRRGQDLKRPDCTTSNTKTIKYPDYRFALPICQMEMQSNENMIQNDGYSVTE